MDSGIYKIQSKIKPQCIYVGSAIDLKRRKHEHLYQLRNKNHNPKLQNHFNKYGEDDLVFSIIEKCDPESLIKREQYYIDKLRPVFNCNPTAQNSLGRIVSEETKKKLRGRYISEETRRKLSIAGRGNARNRGKRWTMSDEAKQKRSEAFKGANNPQFGKPISDKTKKKISDKLKGNQYAKGKHWKLSNETKRKMSRAFKGRKNWLGKTHSEETKKKIKEALLRYWAERRAG